MSHLLKGDSLRLTKNIELYPNMSTIVSTTSLPVMEAFYTLQGEGYYQGNAAYFIRLGGCDVGCVWCDVKESWDAGKHPQKTVTTIIDEMEQTIAEAGVTSSSTLVVITGGEPLLHDLWELSTHLKKKGYRTNIETSGSSPLTGHWDWICLSPKKFKAPLPAILPIANELKIIVFNHSDFAWAKQYASQVSPQCKLYLQPEWEKAATVMPLIINYIKLNPQWQLSLQIHKYINVP